MKLLIGVISKKINKMSNSYHSIVLNVKYNKIK